MELIEATISATLDTFSMLGISAEFLKSTKQESLSSGSQVNTIIGFTDGVKGNMMLEMDKVTARKIASAMMCGAEITELDEISVSAIAELCNMIIGNSFTLCDNDKLRNFSPPSVFIGDKVLLMMSRIETDKLHFLVDGCPFYILISVEK